MVHIGLILALVFLQGLASYERVEACTLTSALPDPQSGCCGKDGTSSKITGGSAAEIDQYPWLAILEYKFGDLLVTVCSGSLISGRYVLTAAHCVLGRTYGAPINVRLGDYDTSQAGPDCVPVAGGDAGDVDCAEAPVVIPVERAIPHPEYRPIVPGKRHDIALLRLTKNAPYTFFVRPICLPVTDVTANFPASDKLFAAGWGAVDENTPHSNVKLHVGLPYYSMEECQATWKELKLWPDQVCAGGEAGKDSCQGDSGGPLMYSKGNYYELVGIASFGPRPCGLAHQPGVYAKVYQYLEWIRSTIES